MWVYADGHLKVLPESFELRPEGEKRDYQTQLILALGPPGKYGEEIVEVPVDNGQPHVLRF